MATALTRTERDILHVLQSVTEPIHGRELLGRAIGARFFVGDCTTHVRHMRLKGVPIVTAADWSGYYLAGQYTEPPRTLPSPVVVVEQGPLFAALSAAYEAMWQARAEKWAA